jgi:hypothetical protein
MVKGMASTKKTSAKRAPAKKKAPARRSTKPIAGTEVRESAFNLPASLPTQHEGLPLGHEDLVPDQPAD